MLEKIPWTALALGALLACAEDRLADGELCEAGDMCRGGPCNIVGVDCRSGHCLDTGYCSGGGCSKDEDCAPGWGCDRVQTQEGSFLGVFHGDEFADLCVPRCPCPELFTCDDMACDYDPEWTPPGAPTLNVLAPAQVGVDVPATLRVEVSSADGAEIAGITWYFHGGAQATGAEVEHSFRAEEALERQGARSFYLTVEVSDAAGNTSHRSLSIDRCSVAGEACDAVNTCCGGVSLCTYTSDPNDDPERAFCSTL